uniref:Transmembrane protein n=1 Tax=Arabidopsis thaliana TaxID=3702 RepID=Q0WUZ4_ARATH|nr:hypothetical protein [Arabidopsis thaliana]
MERIVIIEIRRSRLSRRFPNSIVDKRWPVSGRGTNMSSAVFISLLFFLYDFSTETLVALVCMNL